MINKQIKPGFYLEFSQITRIQPYALIQTANSNLLTQSAVEISIQRKRIKCKSSAKGIENITSLMRNINQCEISKIL